MKNKFDPPSEEPVGIPNCRFHDLPMEYDNWWKIWYCPSSHYEDLEVEKENEDELSSF